MSSAWCYVVDTIYSPADFLNACQTRVQWADPLRVESGTTEATHAMYRKQLESLGAPTWPSGDRAKDLRSERQKAMPYVRYLESEFQTTHVSILSIWNITTDGGPDQVKFRSLVKTESMFSLGDLVFDQSCFQHQSALITKSLLLQVDRWLSLHKQKFKYYSSIAKLCHLWRDHNRQVYTNWVDQFGAVSANEHTRTLIPKCISGRWGAIHKCQKRIKEVLQHVNCFLHCSFGGTHPHESRTHTQLTRNNMCVIV